MNVRERRGARSAVRAGRDEEEGGLSVSSSDQTPQGKRRRLGAPGIAALIAVAVLLLASIAVGALVVSLDRNREAQDAESLLWTLEHGGNVNVVPAALVKVIDGDTAQFRLEGGAVEKVRMIGVDAPEHPGVSDRYTEGSKKRAQKLLGRDVRVYLEPGVKNRDRYGQMLVYVWLAKPSARPSADEVRDKMLNARLLYDGYVKTFPVEAGVTYANVRYAELFKTLEAQAQAAQRGFWSPKYEDGFGAVVGDVAGGVAEITTPYVGNATSRFFHRSECENAQEMKVSNRVPLETAREARDQGFKPCGLCNP